MMSDPAARAKPRRIALVMSDVDGTLVTKDKILTASAAAAVKALRARGLAFTIASSRPPFGLRSLVEPLGLDKPFAAFNGGLLTNARGEILRAHWVDPDVARGVIAYFEENRVEVWGFTSKAWLCRDASGDYVAHERRTVSQDPTVVTSFEPFIAEFGKIVAVCADGERLAALEAEARARFGQKIQVVRSQAYYLDVTHPEANKAQALITIAGLLDASLSECVAIGDGANDLGMLRTAAYGIAMGNGVEALRRAADFVSLSNDEEGFSVAVAHILEEGG